MRLLRENVTPSAIPKVGGRLWSTSGPLVAYGATLIRIAAPAALDVEA
jgi:hypothetical protein